MSARIVEIPVAPFHETEVTNSILSNDYIQKRPSVDLDGFLNNDYLEYLSSGTTSSSPTQANTKKDDPCISDTSLYSLEPDDFNSSVFLEEDDLLAPYSNGEFNPFPESPSMKELRSKMGNMEKPSMSGQKQEKEEDNEEESSPPSSGSEDESEEVLVKKESDYILPQLIEDYDQLRPIKKTRIGVQKNESFSSISSYSSASSSDENDNEHENEDDFDEEYDEEDDEMASGSKKRELMVPKKYQQPVSFRADNLAIGNWSLEQLIENTGENITFDIKILFGRRKIKYELCYPQKTSKFKKIIYSIDFPFTFLSAIEFKNSEKKITFQLCERPSFSKKEKGKCNRTTDFTDANASTSQRHYITVENELDYSDFMERLLASDRRLRQLSKVGLSPIETTFPTLAANYSACGIPPCDWDKEGKATKRCEDCKSNYCDVCDDVLHRHENQKTHRRIPIEVYVRPAPPPKPKKCSMKKRKKMNNDRCRCGTGATKGTLGEPCTGNRCPCFSNGKSCVHCGCKGCANPIKRNPRSPSAASVKIAV